MVSPLTHSPLKITKCMKSWASLVLTASVISCASAEPSQSPHVVVKLGGSAVTHKAEFETLNTATLATTARQIKESSATIVLVHGCGSFGHFQAHKYGVSKGVRAPEFSWMGFAKTRRSATTLTGHVLNALLQEDVPAVHLSPFPQWRKRSSPRGRVQNQAGIRDVKAALRAGLLPVLHGDAVLDEREGCGILSGDALLEELCLSLRPTLVVFLTDVAGVYDRPPSEPGAKLLRDISVRRNGEIVLPVDGGAGDGGKDAALGISSTTAAHDVTGGIAAKLRSAAVIAATGLDVCIVEAGTPHAAEALAGQWPERCTRVTRLRGGGGLGRASGGGPDHDRVRAANRLRGGALTLLDGALGATSLTAALISLNIAQNGSPAEAARRGDPLPTPCSQLQDVGALSSKSAFVRLWHEGSVPTLLNGEELFDGQLSDLGVLAPVSGLITNRLFGGGRRWSGKIISGDSGVNLFAADDDEPVRLRSFGVLIGDSAVDGRPCLILDYADATSGDLFWGRVLGMRDEIREVNDGLYFGLGSMRATGGPRNAAPFVLARRGASIL